MHSHVPSRLQSSCLASKRSPSRYRIGTPRTSTEVPITNTMQFSRKTTLIRTLANKSIVYIHYIYIIEYSGSNCRPPMLSTRAEAAAAAVGATACGRCYYMGLRVQAGDPNRPRERNACAVLPSSLQSVITCPGQSHHHAIDD
jgi:hypothetical protein